MTLEDDTKAAVAAVARYGYAVEARGTISRGDEIRQAAKDGLLFLQSTAKENESFRENPFTFLGGVEFEKFAKVVNGQVDKNSKYYLTEAQGMINFYDHEGYMRAAVEKIGKKLSTMHSELSEIQSFTRSAVVGELRDLIKGGFRKPSELPSNAGRGK